MAVHGTHFDEITTEKKVFELLVSGVNIEHGKAIRKIDEILIRSEGI